MSTRYDYVLWSETDDDQGAWRFVVRSVDGQQIIEAEEQEPEIRGERLQLLAIVRGLEALDHPAQVALVTRSRCIYRGLTYGLRQWRAQGWMWESYGRMTPVKNADLWKRLDRAARIHTVECRTPAAIRHVRRHEQHDRQPIERTAARSQVSWLRRAANTATRWISNVAASGHAEVRDRRLVCE